MRSPAIEVVQRLDRLEVRTSELALRLNRVEAMLGIAKSRIQASDEQVPPIDRSIFFLHLPATTEACLLREGVDDLRKLTALTPDDLMRFKRFGWRSLDFIEKKLNELGLQLKPVPANRLSFFGWEKQKWESKDKKTKRRSSTRSNE